MLEPITNSVIRNVYFIISLITVAVMGCLGGCRLSV